jgi:dihydroorotate dehydrogenase
LYNLLRPVLFRLDAERAHGLTLAALRAAGNFGVSRWLLRELFELNDPRLVVEAFGLRFNNPVGLAAGYDKNGTAVSGLSALGFGHVEVGTVTRLPQAGNPRPRIHRLADAQALVNSMGFPNAGIEALPAKLRAARGLAGSTRVPTRIGVNLGKGRDTPLDRAVDDYCALLLAVHARGQADYLAINVSSPNTLGLRQLQARQTLESLLATLIELRDGLRPRLPLLVKVAPDLSETETDDVLAAVTNAGADGLIVANTTVNRDGVPEAAELPGGVSGAPVRARSTAMIRRLARQTAGRLPIVGVGGILSPADALEKLRAGAALIQIYTGLVYTGPGLVRAINQELVRACERDGLPSVRDLASTLQP